MAEDIIEGVKPTRMELLGIRKRKKLAEKGHKLLSEKRDALVVQFFDIIEKRSDLREKSQSLLQKAYQSMISTEMLIGRETVENILETMPTIGEVPISSVNIMGVKVPRVQGEEIEPVAEMPYGYLDTTAKLDDAVGNFHDALQLLLQLAEIEGSIERLAREIEKTKRRVNALEHIFIPRLSATEKYIEMQLQEREREDFFRRKRIKAIMEAAEQ